MAALRICPPTTSSTFQSICSLQLRDERSAQSRLDDILGSETRNAVARHELIEIIHTTKGGFPYATPC